MVAVALMLGGCSVIDRVAVRLNLDGSFDVATCEELDVVESMSAEVYEWSDELEDFTPLTIESIPTSISEGDVVRLEAPPASTNWDQMSFIVTGKIERSSGTRESMISGAFNREDLVVDEWIWPSGYFTQSIQECEIFD